MRARGRPECPAEVWGTCSLRELFGSRFEKLSQRACTPYFCRPECPAEVWGTCSLRELFEATSGLCRNITAKCSPRRIPVFPAFARSVRAASARVLPVEYGRATFLRLRAPTELTEVPTEFLPNHAQWQPDCPG